MRTTTAIAALIGLCAATGASAADLPRPYNKAPTYVAPTYYNWTGFYAGLNGGYGWSNSFGTDAKGAVYGAQLGYNWQTGAFVFGVEGDFQGTSIKASDTVGAVTAEAKISSFATVRGRIGYAFDRLMIYGTGGWAYVDTKATLSAGGLSIDDSAWSSGYAVGGGVEWAAWNRWSVKGEYLFVHSGDVTLTLAGATATGNFDTNIIRAGLNYRF